MWVTTYYVHQTFRPRKMKSEHGLTHFHFRFKRTLHNPIEFNVLSSIHFKKSVTIKMWLYANPKNVECVALMNNPWRNSKLSWLIRNAGMGALCLVVLVGYVGFNMNFVYLCWYWYRCITIFAAIAVAMCVMWSAWLCRWFSSFFR